LTPGREAWSIEAAGGGFAAEPAQEERASMFDLVSFALLFCGALLALSTAILIARSISPTEERTLREYLAYRDAGGPKPKSDVLETFNFPSLDALDCFLDCNCTPETALYRLRARRASLR
jgi:hypothetical protein